MTMQITAVAKSPTPAHAAELVQRAAPQIAALLDWYEDYRRKQEEKQDGHVRRASRDLDGDQ
jgi:hypothetical protein